MRETVGVNRRRSTLFLKHILRKLFLEDWPIKVSALVITFALWYGVSYSNKKGTATMDADVAFRVADNATLTSVGAQHFSAKISGDDRKIDDLINRREKIPITVDLTDMKPGDLVIQLTPSNMTVDLPTGVRLDDIQPSRIAVNLEPLEDKDLPVKAETVGQPATGFEVYNTTVTPARVGVRGPESYVSTLDSVPTGTVDITGAKEDLTFRQVPISLPNAKAAVFNTVVDVAVRIGEKRVERTFALTTASGKRVTAVLYGPRSLMSKMKPADLRVEIVKMDTGEDTPRLILPDAFLGTVEIRSAKIS
ncbi:MAG TPA: CdaR family protein [Pyrinomonadaceae bacterium]|nr:CdaR family protein [Pyrinomonadaceae bacterium]